MRFISGALRSPILALTGAVAPVWPLGGSLVFGSWRPGYDVSHAISELGQQGSTNAVTWNVIGFGGAALLFALYSVAVAAGLGRGWLFRVNVLLAVCLAGSGLFSCDPGCPPVMETRTGWMHTVFGLTSFATITVAPYVAWRTFRGRGEWRSYGPISLGVGVLLTVLFLVGPFFGAERVGIWQRTTLLLYFAWAVAVALRLYRSLRSPGEAKENTLNIVSTAR